MKRQTETEFIFSESFTDINNRRFIGYIVHMICLAGKGSFLYNGKEVQVTQNDALIISHPELVSDIKSHDIRVEYVATSAKFIYNLLPANHYGVGGGISLFENPVIPLSNEDAMRFIADIHRMHERWNDTEHLFYTELIGSLTLTMVYDLFDFHAKLHDGVSASNHTTDIVRRLLSLLEGGRCKQHRAVAYYAKQLNVTAKYLSETVKRNTGQSVSYLIDRHTIPMITEYLRNSDLSLTQICDEMNFSSLSYFSRYVQKHLGISPSKYRETHSPVRKKLT